MATTAESGWKRGQPSFVPPRKSSRRFKYRPSRRNGVPQRAPGRLYAVPRAAAGVGGGWKMPVATGTARCRLGPVEEGDEASERIVDQKHARRHRTPNHCPLPLRSSTTASCATIIGCVRSPRHPGPRSPCSRRDSSSSISSPLGCTDRWKSMSVHALPLASASNHFPRVMRPSQSPER